MLAVALEAAAAAASVHERHFRGSFRVVDKGGDDLVTEVDHEAESVVREVLKSARPADDVVGEESADTPSASPSHVRWIVDPLDGTANFVRGVPHFAVSIGVEVAGVPVVGVVHAVAMGELVTGVVGEAATRNGTAITVAPVRALRDAVLATGFAPDREHRRRQGSVIGTLLAEIRDIRRFGNPALDLCAVASGRVDGFFEIGLGPWDYCAGQAIVSAAGGRVDVIDCSPWRGPLVVAGADGLVAELVEALARAGVPVGT